MRAEVDRVAFQQHLLWALATQVSLGARAEQDLRMAIGAIQPFRSIYIPLGLKIRKIVLLIGGVALRRCVWSGRWYPLSPGLGVQ